LPGPAAAFLPGRAGGILFPAICLAIAFLVYWFVQRDKIGILAEHAADTPPPGGTEIIGAK